MQIYTTYAYLQFNFSVLLKSHHQEDVELANTISLTVPGPNAVQQKLMPV